MFKQVQLFYFITFLILLLYSCNNNEIIEPAGSAEYLINNQTTGELSVSFITSSALDFMNVDTIPSIRTGESRIIFFDGIIGVNPKPSDSFSQLTFLLNNNENSKYTISQIENDIWEIIESDIGGSGYGLTKYELIVTDEDFE